MTDNIIEVKDLTTKLGDTIIHKDLNLTVKKGEVLGIVGGSGSGKTTLLRTILSLTRPMSGSIRVFGQEITTATPEELLKIQRRWGVLFQSNALFSSLTVLENVSFPLKEHSHLSKSDISDLAVLKIMLAGLNESDANKYPSELSGGMEKRAGLARSIVLDPELLFLDEPSAGLDPTTASGFDELILDLQSTMGLTIVMVTHDLDSLWRVTNRVAFLGNKGVIAVEPLEELVKMDNPLIQGFFRGPRGRIAEAGYQHGSEDHGH